MTEGNVVQARTIQGIDIKTRKIMKLFALQSGRYHNDLFITKDLYNRMDKECRRDVINGDAEGAIAFLSAKQDLDSMFFFSFNLDEDRRQRHLFWLILDLD